MKTLKLLNKLFLFFFLIFNLIFASLKAEEEAQDIWNIDFQKKEKK